MTPEQFVYWLQGYAELTDCAELTTKQWDMVKEKLDGLARNGANHMWRCDPYLVAL